REFSSLYSPSVGRPRWLITITLAPAFRQCSMVGMEALMRASDVTLPSFTGTFRSARISTRLPARSRSVILITDMALLLGSWMINTKARGEDTQIRQLAARTAHGPTEAS